MHYLVKNRRGEEHKVDAAKFREFVSRIPSRVSPADAMKVISAMQSA
jgi:hypothetical protein